MPAVSTARLNAHRASSAPAGTAWSILATRCWLKGAIGDALHAIICAAGYNIRRSMRAIVVQAAKAAKKVFVALSRPALYGLNSAMDALIDLRDVHSSIRIAVRVSLGPLGGRRSRRCPPPWQSNCTEMVSAGPSNHD